MTLGEAQSYLQGEKDHLLFVSRKAEQHKEKGELAGEGRQKPATDLKILCSNNGFSWDELQPLLKTKALTDEIGLLWF